MNIQIEVTEFDRPSGNIRGVVVAFATNGQLRKRVAHATLMCDAEPEIVLTVPRSLNTEETTTVAEGLLEFVERVRSLCPQEKSVSTMSEKS